MLNFDAHQAKLKTKKYLENIVNQEHLSSHIINIFKDKIDDKTGAELQNMLYPTRNGYYSRSSRRPGDNIDRAMLQFQVQELCPAIAAKLNRDREHRIIITEFYFFTQGTEKILTFEVPYKIDGESFMFSKEENLSQVYKILFETAAESLVVTDWKQGLLCWLMQ